MFSHYARHSARFAVSLKVLPIDFVGVSSGDGFVAMDIKQKMRPYPKSHHNRDSCFPINRKLQLRWSLRRLPFIFTKNLLLLRSCTPKRLELIWEKLEKQSSESLIAMPKSAAMDLPWQGLLFVWLGRSTVLLENAVLNCWLNGLDFSYFFLFRLLGIVRCHERRNGSPLYASF